MFNPEYVGEVMSEKGKLSPEQLQQFGLIDCRICKGYHTPGWNCRASLTSATAPEPNRPLTQPQNADELAATLRDIFEGKAVFCNINGESGKAAFFAPEVKLDVATRLIREWSNALASATEGERDADIEIPFCDAPCGHSSQYCYSENGGKQIICLLCEHNERTAGRASQGVSKDGLAPQNNLKS
jgi:hypothetical protein